MTDRLGEMPDLSNWGSARGSSFRRSGSLRSLSGVLGSDHHNVFGSARMSDRGDEMDDEEALRWAAMERLPTVRRMRTAMIHRSPGKVDHVDVAKIGPLERQLLIDNLLKVIEEDNEIFLLKLRKRIDNVGIELPTIEVRYENLSVDADCYVGSRALPTLWNSARNFAEQCLQTIRISTTKKTVLNILNNVNGIIKPQRMTLLLGPPGSGKTTLLLALAGKLDKDLHVKGTVTYNGHNLDEFVPQKTAVYISQNDLHVAQMTVRETLDFSARCQGTGTRYELLSELARREKQAGIFPEADVDLFMKATALSGVESSLATDYTLKILGLDVCADTLVGDNMRRGISGGQKKRVTTGEMIVGPTRAMFMDEISTGLDSSTTFQIVKSLRQFAHVMSSTVLMSLLQPAPETFELFDDIILLSEGQIVYHGPREHVLEFFEECGFRCPDRKGVADFLQEVTSKKDQEQYWMDKRRPYHYVSVTDFEEKFKRFHVGVAQKLELAHPYPKHRSHRAALTHEKYTVTKKEIFKATFAKEVLLMKRDAFVYIFKTSQLAIMAAVSMTVFFRSKLHQETVADGTIYLGSLFFTVVCIMFNGFGELSMTIFRLPVFFKQRDLLFYPAWAFSLPSFVLSIPMSAVESSIWTFMTYYVTGYAPEASRFFKQLLLLFSVHQMSSGLFRLIGAVCKTIIMAYTGGSFLLLIIFMLGGFIIPRPDIKSWWIWGYWISPLAYAENAISINEMLAPRWSKFVPGKNHTLGELVLMNRGIFTESYWYWISVGALFGFAILFNIGFTIALDWMRPLGKPQAVISEEALAERNEKLNRSRGISEFTNGTTSSIYSGKFKSREEMARAEDIGGRNSSSQHWLSLATQRSGGTNALSKSTIEMKNRDHFVALDEAEAALGNALEATLEVAGFERKRGMILPFQPLSISFDDLKYYVDMPAEMKSQGVPEDRLQLLRGVTGAFRPGVLTALVGVSGAGKTTLMDVLAGRKTGGYIEGDIRINGYPKNQETFARIAGYCEQVDIHSPQVTVRESLIYSAWLRLSSDCTPAMKMKFVEEVMELVELKPLQDALVGLPGVTGLSTEQRKRLTIAVELVANPSIIFMDEPTSGLDARAAAIVMRTVRNTVDTGRTVVCTIHQPSIDIFEAFDELLLMKRGGQVIYMGPLGPRSHKLVEYFEAVPGVPMIKEGHNPATWMLEVSSVAMESQLEVDFAEVYQASSLFMRNKELVTQLKSPIPGTSDLHFPTKYSQPFKTQLTSCLWKQKLTYWRTPDYNCVRFCFSAVAAVLFGTIFWNLGQKTANSQDLFTVMGAMYGAVLFLGINNCGTVQPMVGIERTVFYRERAAGMYSAIPYALAQVLIEIPYVMVQTLVYALITYSMINFEWTFLKFFWYSYFMFLMFISFTYYGMMMVALTPNTEIASIVASFFYSFFNLFSGFLIPKPKIPIWWAWYYWACPVAWTIYGLIVSQFGDVGSNIIVLGDESNVQSVEQFIKSYFGFRHDFLPVVSLMMAIFPVLFASVFIFGIKFLNFQHR
ncbi:hypothetical protein KC19_5G197200 [Ceratodon purpureus]|uniref:ABC transporter domain-containing protein n=1 Tax=Ceratodon purpureus TaxID=3225 RepID=A0A8T0I4L4_CERPU|nr:hypothetical protein KC19_5G197200 [Ceratodon purpureus]